MYATSTGYGDAVYADDRTVDVYISIGTGIDTTAADDITSITSTAGLLPMSNTAQATDAVYTLTEGLATFEGDGIPLDGSAVVPPAFAQDYPPETGLWSAGISDASGNIDFDLSIEFSKAHTSALRVYTGVKITSATATFREGTTGVTKTFACYDGYIEIADVMTYDSIDLGISSIDGAYMHARIVEIEFGASKAISGTELGGEITCIRELDPTEMSMPMDELDFSLVNVAGDFDSDKSDTRLSEVRPGFPVWLSFTVNSASARHTIPMGRYWIAETDSTDTMVSITAFDARHTLADMSTAWSISAGASVGEAIDDLLTSMDIPHTVESEVISIVSDTGASFGTDTSVADDLLIVGQAFGIYIIPDRQGSLRVTTKWPAQSYGAVPVASIYIWPTPKQNQSYNYISVSYGQSSGQVAETDLRTDASAIRSILQVSDNPLITTQERAESVRDRLASRIMSETVEADWRGDPAMDLGDTVQIPGRWTQDAPMFYIANYIEMTYDGVLSARMRGSR